MRRQQYLELHTRFLRGDLEARDELLHRLLKRLPRLLARRFADRTNCEESVQEALWDYIRSPQRFDPKKSGLETYLYRAAHRNMLDIYRRSLRLREDPISRYLDQFPDRGRDDILAHLIQSEQHRRILDAVTRSPQETCLLSHRLSGETDYRTLARTIGLTGDSSADRHAVKAILDRLNARLRRLLRRARSR